MNEFARDEYYTFLATESVKEELDRVGIDWRERTAAYRVMAFLVYERVKLGANAICEAQKQVMEYLLEDSA